MAWTTPKTDWETGELVAASDMNAIGENLAALKNLARAVGITTEDIVVDTVQELFEDVDSDNLNLTITTQGGDVLVHFDGVLRRGSGDGTDNCFDVEVDGNRQGGVDGFMRTTVLSYRVAESFTRLIQNLSAGTHTFKLQWRNWKHVRLSAGAQFWVREI